jgi:hypothetical protein
MSANTSDSGYEPADLSELTATDALLDRLGGRKAGGDDLLDPAAALLMELVAVVDLPRSEPDTGLAHLVEVLAGRPLYLAQKEEAADAADVEPVINLEMAETDLEVAGSRVIDLTDAEANVAESDVAEANVAEADDTDESKDADESSEADEREESDESELPAPIQLPAARTLTGSPSTAPTVIPIQSGRQRWERALSHVSLPAASVLLLLAISGGVSAAVTGNPMTPVNGVSKVMAQLPGVDNPQRSLSHVKGEITAASNAVRVNDASSASRHLAAARRGLSDVPDDQKPQLRLMIANVETLLAGPLAPSSVVPTPPVGVGATTAPITSTPEPSTQPSSTPSAAAPTKDPTTAPEPTTDPTAPVVVPDTTPPDEPTPDPTTS